MSDKMLTSIKNATRLLFFVGLLCTVLAQELNPTVSPDSEFIARPRNITVIEGFPVILRCKMKETIHNCQWFYLEEGLDMFDSRAESVLVKEFRPTRERDCSIKLSKTRVIQSGQWVCKGLQIHARKYVVSKPAFLRVLAIKDESPVTGQSDIEEEGKNHENELSTDLSFHLTEEGHIINTNLGDTAIMGCKVNKELESCSWIKPDGTTLHIEETDASELYRHIGNFTEGNCSLMIGEVSARDEGNWRCVVSAMDHSGDKLGPLIHLHVLEFGAHFEGDQSLLRRKTNGISLIGILVATSVVLLVVIVGLVCYMYRRVWRNNSAPHKHLEASRSGNSDYSSYGTTWHQGVEGMISPTKLVDGDTEMQSPSNQYTRYLDMTGKGGKGEGYVMFPASSVRSSMSSRTTVSTVPVGHNAVLDSDHSARTSTNLSLHSSSSLGGESSHGREPVHRNDSVESDGHLYEEIDETRLRRKDSKHDLPEYANIDEDHEGYMIPRMSTPALSSSPLLSETDVEPNEAPKAPPYSKVAEGGLVPDTDASPFVSNLTYSADKNTAENSEAEADNTQECVDEPPVPTRIDSVDNPLANYDVPKRSGDGSDPVFV